MTASVFRLATCQAIREIIEENAVAGRFGLIITEETMDTISERVVDLIEMALNLRQYTQDRGMSPQASSSSQGNTHKDTAQYSGQLKKNKPRQQVSDDDSYALERENTTPRSLNVSEVMNYANHKNMTEINTSLPAQHDFKLPRKSFGMSQDEKNQWTRKSR